MDKKSTGEVGFFGNLSAVIRGELRRRKEDGATNVYDIIVFFISLVFAGCHIAFGSYPLATAFLAVLPRGAFIGLIGAVIGSLIIGESGVIYAIIAIIVVFLRVIISGGDGRIMFSEPLLLRICSASVGAFVGAAYEVLLESFAFKAILYGVCGVLFSAAFALIFSFLFDTSISFNDVIFGSRDIFVGKKQSKDKFNLITFQISFLVTVFLVSLSLKEYDFFGITPAYIFSAIITLFVAKRFGAIRAMSVGFVTSFGISSTYSVAFALLGLGSAVLFEAGVVYGLIGGGVLLSAWSAYSDGLMGFLSTFPEYMSAALIFSPFVKKLRSEKNDSSCDSKSKMAKDMVASTSLAYKNSNLGGIGLLEEALGRASSVLRSFGKEEGKLTRDERLDVTICAVKSYCERCPSYAACKEISPAPCLENIEKIASALSSDYKDDSPEIGFPSYCTHESELKDHIISDFAKVKEERFKKKSMTEAAEEYELLSKLVAEAREYDEREKMMDGELSNKLADVFSEHGLGDGCIIAFGEHKKHFIGAGEDRDGRLITAPALHRAIEDAAGVKLGQIDYYRQDEIALFEASSAPLMTVEYACASLASGSDSPSGDTQSFFETADGRFFSVISDGMGSGEIAARTSSFSASFLSHILTSSCSKSTALHILNHLIRICDEECSATVDLFELDKITGEAMFYKCGAAASYVKRESSIFRIKSETAPIGLMKSIDAERIRVEVKSGDYVIMLSDGVSQTTEDAIWLLELLNCPPKPDIKAYAEYILEEARKNSKSGDDMSVSVIRILNAA